MISPILPAHDVDTIALDLGVFIARRSRQFRCSREAVIAVIHAALPSQPVSPKLPAASTPAAAPADVKAEEVPPVASSADPSPEPQPTSTPAVQALDPLVPTQAIAVDPTSLPGADGAADRAPITEPADAGNGSSGASKAETGKSAEPSGSAAPVKRITQRQRVKACHEQHPDWGAAEIAAELDMSKANVWSIASQISIKFASKTNATTEALRKAVEASPTKPQEPVERAGPPTPRAEPKRPPVSSADGKPLKHRVAETHRDHPDWSTAQIAEHLGAKLGSVSHALHDARTAAGTAAVEIIPPANPQTPVAPPPTGEKRTLTERVRSLHQQHPTWTATMIAHELGAKQTSVSTILGQVRGKPTAPVEEPQFKDRREMVAHYGEIAKRLGKS